MRGGKLKSTLQTLKKKTQRNYKEWFKILTIIGLLAITLTAPIKPQKEVKPLGLVRFNKTGLLPIGGQEPLQIAFKQGPSNKELRKLAVLGRNRTVVVRERAPEPGPSLEEKRTVYREVAGRYGIDPKILESVHQVETGKSWGTTRKSYAGATGPMQFMPGTWRKYQTDGNGDGQTSIHDPVDALHGAAKLLAVNGAASGEVKRALFSYNHSQAYVNKVLRIAESIK